VMLMLPSAGTHGNRYALDTGAKRARRARAAGLYFPAASLQQRKPSS
jgi:hypothetical protein